MGSQDDRQSTSIVEDDEHVDRSLAVTGEPIAGTDKVVFDEETNPGALAAPPLTSPKGMSARQRAIHDLFILQAAEYSTSVITSNSQSSASSGG